MAKEPHPNLKAHCFKKGQSGNPQGARLHNPELRAIKRLTAAEVAEIGALIVCKNVTKLQEIVNDAIGTKSRKANSTSKHSALKVWMARVAIRGIAKGDMAALDGLLNRLVGRVTEKIELTGKDGGPVKQMVGQMTPEERAAELKRIRRIRKEAGND